MAVLFVCGLTLLLSMTVLNPAAYNFHDDFQSYFLQPAKMIQTGSAFGSPLGLIGKEVLGGQGLFQAFFVHNLGVGAINVFDAVFCLLLGVVLLLEEGYRRRIPGFALLAAALLAIIHAQIVNISATYSAVVLMMASVLLITRVFGDQPEHLSRRIPSIVSLALCYAALVTVKSSFVLFPVLHVAWVVLLFAIAQRAATKTIKTATAVALISLLVTIPWASWPLMSLGNISGAEAGSVVGDPESVALLNARQPSFVLDFLKLDVDIGVFGKLVSTRDLFWGASPLLYSMLAVLTLLGGILAVLLMCRRHSEGRKVVLGNETLSLAAASMTAATIFLLITGLFQPSPFLFDTALRYAIPFLIGLGPLVFLLFHALLRHVAAKAYLRHAWFASSLLVLAGFMPQAYARYQQADHCGSILAFTKTACSSEYLSYNETILRGSVKDWVASWQQQVPAGEPIIAVMSTSFFLDFNRNEILEVDLPGLQNPWVQLPESGYLLWEFGWMGSRRPEQLKGTLGKSLIQSMLDMEKTGHSQRVFKGQYSVIWKFEQPRG